MASAGDNLFDNLTGNTGSDGRRPSRPPVRTADHATSGNFEQNVSDLTAAVERLTDVMSQQAARDAKRNKGNVYDAGRDRSSSSLFGKPKGKGQSKSFLDGFQDEIMKGLGLDQIQDSLKAGLKGLADNMGVDVKDLRGELGKSFAQDIQSALSQTNIGSDLVSSLRSGTEHWAKKTEDILKNGAPLDLKGELGKSIKDFSSSAMKKLKGGAEKIIGKDGMKGLSDDFKSMKDGLHNTRDKLADTRGGKKLSELGDKADALKGRIGDTLGGVKDKLGDTKAGKAISGVMQRGGAAMSAITKGAASTALKGGVSAAIGSAGGPVGIAVMALLENITNVLAKIGESAMKLISSLGNAMDREEAHRKKLLEEGQRRLEKDLELITSRPFKILEEAAQKVYDAWDANLAYINQTQGYTKAELQTLMGSYSNRLRSEGLGSIISGADVTDNLKRVLESGLTGPVAEEFAYLATKLTSAVPTDDFFKYASTYASLVANAQKEGMDSAAATAYANAQLEQFASNLIYSGRELSGGFTTGLKNATDLFDQSVQIAMVGRSGNVNQISGVLTSVSAIVGAIAPGLESGIVSAITDAAMGGNSDTIVALRSLAGGNASNTEFLKMLVNDPQTVFSNLFRNLAEMQNMSPDNYMEVAEGLASVFGIDKSALQRVDFAYLADAVAAMNVNSASLDENLKLLESGQSTLSKEQEKIAQINEYLVEEGLSYVLDSEVARQVQQHMWDEQMAVQLQENTYGVEIRGAALGFLNELQSAVKNILGFLNPFGMIGKIAGLVQSIDEAIKADDTVRQVLEAGKVGSGNSEILGKLTSYGQDLNLTRKYLEIISDVAQGKGKANYVWGQVGKSMAAGLGTASTGSRAANSAIIKASAKSEDTNLAKLQSNFDKMLGSMPDFFSGTASTSVEAAIEEEKRRIAATKTVDASDLASLISEYMGAGFGMSRDLAVKRAQLTLQKRAEIAAEEEAKRIVNERVASGSLGASGYEAWAATASQYGISNLESAMNELGYDVNDVKNYFSTQDAQNASNEKLERESREDTFWANTQELLDTLNVNIHDVFDKSDMMGIFRPELIGKLDTEMGFEAGGLNKRIWDFNNDFNSWAQKWVNYYINHTYYSERVGSSALAKAQENSGKKGVEKLTELIQVMRENGVSDLTDPVVQQNTLLAEILWVLQGIFQQNNTQGKLTLPDALSALAVGYTEVDPSTNKTVTPKTKSSK